MGFGMIYSLFRWLLVWSVLVFPAQAGGTQAQDWFMQQLMADNEHYVARSRLRGTVPLRRHAGLSSKGRHKLHRWFLHQLVSEQEIGQARLLAIYGVPAPHPHPSGLRPRARAWFAEQLRAENNPMGLKALHQRSRQPQSPLSAISTKGSAAQATSSPADGYVPLHDFLSD